MIDAHFHRRTYDTFLGGDGIERRFSGVHPWQSAEIDMPSAMQSLESSLAADPAMGVGEIGLDRLKAREIPEVQRQAFERQLELAAVYRRPVVLHGAKCWGEVVKACRPYAGTIPSFLFHGFSRSEGLLAEIFSMNGFVSIGPALLNDHAVNYRRLAATLPPDRILVETDLADDDPAAGRMDVLADIHGSLARLRGLAQAELESILAANARRFMDP
ncbi:MAG: TatD family hydrolase [Kiritimatiellae bacterium]|nr:TatD family hydrolase [Kiritimatiellia bacterium]